MLRIDINILFTVINLIVLAVAMRLFLFKPVHKILDERQKRIDQDLANAAEAKASAEALEKQRQDSLAGIQDEREKLMLDARSSAASESDRLLADAKTQAVKIVTSAQAEAELKKKEILDKTQSEISEIVVTAAAKLALQQKTGENGGDLYDTFLRKARDGND